MSKVRILNGTVVRELLPFERCIGLMQQAMKRVAQGRAQQPIRQVMQLPDARGRLSMMPGSLEEPDSVGIKVLSVFKAAVAAGRASHQGVILLFDARHGELRAIVDAREITAIRTAAASAVATDVLAGKSVRSLALFGCGEQAHAHAVALTRVRQFKDVAVWGRDADRVRAFVSRLRTEVGVAVRAVMDVAEAARADVVCTLTSAAQPFFRADWLRSGQHLNVVGSSIPSTSEVEPEVVRRSRYFVDCRTSALALAGEFLRAKEAGLVTDDHIVGCIGDVLCGRIAGRESSADITLFKSLGMVAEDLISAEFVAAEAERRGCGEVVEW